MDQLLVALDVESSERAMQLVNALHDLAGGFKIGNRLFTREGPTLVRRITDAGSRVFLDLKYHDIPNTVEQAVEAAVGTGAWMINVHSSGGMAMMQAAAWAARDTSAKLGRQTPLMIGVTVLTSMDQQALRSIGVERPVLEQVLALARMTKEAGLQGVVASAQETPEIRKACGPDFQIVTPGIRGASAGAERNDQSRTMGPADAIRAGASYLVVGRPIIAAADPRGAAAAIVEELTTVISR
ncbi:MAG: orotidine-5'-phosphate decarboxylase [Acidobacteria bacterium]|nr:MAG: orotidine-5'-phosphate decarboxylase [Acidobacteriota bacterium]